MKKIARLIILAAAMVLCAVSCLDTDAPISSGTMICNVLNPARLETDAGEFLNITENNSIAIPDSVKRVMINCDVLTQHEDNEKEFDIRLLEFAPVTITSPVPASETDGEELGNDGLNITAWCSGGYLNAFTAFTSIEGSTTEHAVNLVLDDTISGKDTLYLKFTHNAFGESFDNPDADVSKIINSGKYFSYDLDPFIPSGVQSIILKIEYEWFISQDNIMIREKRLNSGYLKFTR